MRHFDNIDDLRRCLDGQRSAGGSIAFVPTMGNLHRGHLALVQAAARRCETVVVSIYVNPLQFGENEDLDSYPRTLAADLAALRGEGVYAVFCPDDATMYPRGRAGQTTVEVPLLSELLCGAARPGHFRGVTTVVARLLNIVQPDVACFGKKDYQQLTIIRRMVEDLAMRVEIAGVETVRDDDGLALSSRNAYLTGEQRLVAPELFRSLQTAKSLIGAKADEFSLIESKCAENLQNMGFEPDYFTIRRQSDLAQPGPRDRELVILVAARLGAARLIDNLEVRI